MHERGGRRVVRPRLVVVVVGQRRLMPDPGIEAVADVGNRKFIARTQPAHLDALAVDPDPIGTAQIADHDLIFVLNHAAMMARNAE